MYECVVACVYTVRTYVCQERKNFVISKIIMNKYVFFSRHLIYNYEKLKKVNSVNCILKKYLLNTEYKYFIAKCLYFKQNRYQLCDEFSIKSNQFTMDFPK